MKERPIIFSAPMVRAILAGTKTQTRRVVKRYSADCIGWFDDGDGLWAQRFIDPSSGSPYLKSWRDRCPYGRPGDRLWVREAFIHEPADYCWEASVSIPCRPAFTVYRADHEGDTRGAGWKPSIHMPRWASRITLEITDVRVERLQDISEADAVAEGVRPGDGKWHTLGDGEAVFKDEYGWFAPDSCVRHNAPRHAFRETWEIINGPESWAANPWVWVIEFKRLEQA